MRFWRPTVTGLVAFLLASSLPGGPAVAHPGLGDATITPQHRLEMESYSTPDTNCDPDRDGEHTAVEPRGADTGVFLPFSRCGVTFDNVYFASSGRAGSFRVERYAVSGQTADIMMWVDGVFVAVGRFSHHSSGPTTYEEFPFTGTSPFEAGVHTVRIEYRVTFGQTWYNQWIDWVSFVFDCENEEAVPDPTADGLMEGDHGWGGMDYAFSVADMVDPDGDPFAVWWFWDDGVEGIGNDTVRSFPAPTAGPVTRSFTVRVVEDVSARCTIGVWQRDHGPFTFTVVPEPVVTYDEAAAGKSCNGGLFVPSWLGDDVVLGSCTMRVSIDLGGAPPALVPEPPVFLLDDAVVPPLTTSPPAVGIDAVALGPGSHGLVACAAAAGDKYGRSFCTPDYAFRSIACDNGYARFARVVTDGLSGAPAGWSDRAYTLTADALSDPDGDPVTVRWEWSDDTTSAGPTAARSFAAGDHPYHLVLEENVTARCPEAGVVPTVYGVGGLAPPEPLVFRGLADWAPVLTNPLPTGSCIYTQPILTLTPQANTIIGTCRIKANVDPGAPGVTARGELMFDGTRRLVEREGTSFWGWYESMRYTTGRHWLEVCFEADEDRYDRRFCTPIYAFWNVGRG